ncbi:galectin-4 [Ixodes scapularis]
MPTRLLGTGTVGRLVFLSSARKGPRPPESVPYACPLPGSLTVGSQILIQGLVPAVSLRFSVNLQRGAGEGGDIFLHLNPRFEPSGPVVVRNSLQGKSWGREEREGPSPFAQGRPFLLVITALPQGYEVSTYTCGYSLNQYYSHAQGENVREEEFQLPRIQSFLPSMARA